MISSAVLGFQDTRVTLHTAFFDSFIKLCKDFAVKVSLVFSLQDIGCNDVMVCHFAASSAGVQGTANVQKSIVTTSPAANLHGLQARGPKCTVDVPRTSKVDPRLQLCREHASENRVGNEQLVSL